MNYTDVTQVFDLLESADGLIQITPVHLSGFVSRTSSINADGDIAPGAVNTADIQFSVLDIRGSVSSYTGREFVYRKGYAEAATREKMGVAADLYVKRGNTEYYVSGTSLTATDGSVSNSYTVQKDAGALVLRDNELLVLYSAEPYAERFTVDGVALTSQGSPLLVYDYDKEIAAGYASQRVSYAVDSDTVTTYKAFKMFNVRYLDTTVYEVHTVGYFTFDRPKRGTGGVYTISASDRMTAFDSDYIEIQSGVTESTTARQFLESLCSAANVELAAQDLYNSGLVIVVPDDLESCTGTQMLTWLGELMGCSWRINSAGRLEGVWFAQTSTRLTRDDYVSFNYEAFMVAPIDKVLTGSAYADVVGFAGSGANALVIDQNSLLPYTEQDDLNQFSAGLLTRVATVPEYRPGTLSGYANPTINPGDVIYVDNDDDEMEPVCVTQVTESGFQLTITSSGNQRREVQNYTSSSLQAVKRTVEQLREQTGAFPDQWAQDIENTVNAITGAMGGTRVDLFNPDTKLPSGTAYCLDGDGLATAKKVLVINAGGIAFYNDGFDAENPESNVPAYVVMNNQGKVDASSILTGILTAIIIKSADGESFYADLQKGIVRMKVSEFTVQGKTVDEIAKEKADAALTEANKQLQDYASTVTDSLSDLQGQIDGQIQTWFYNYVPTTSNAPANGWTTDADKAKHLGDLFYIVDNTESGGQAYRWAHVNSAYKWVLIEDTEVAKALATASKAQDTADGKRRTFYAVTPYPPYDVGDLWVQGSSGSIKVCATERQTGRYVESDWVDSSDYINKVTASEVAKEEAAQQIKQYAEVVSGDLENLQTQIDGKVETWFYDYIPTVSNAPAKDWSTDADKSKHIGDLFYVVNNEQYGGQVYRWTLSGASYSWELIEDTEVAKALATAAKAQDTADGKRTVFTSQPVPPYSVGDLWSQGPSGSLLVCKTARLSGSYAAADWQSSADYINQDKASEVAQQEAAKQIGQYAEVVSKDLSELQGQIDGKVETWFYNYVPTLSNAPANGWTSEEDKIKHLGDLFYIVNNEQYGGQVYRWTNADGSYSWLLIEDAAVTKALETASKAQDTADGKRRTFTSQPVPPYDVGDLWSQGPSGSLMVCCNARSSGSYSASDWQSSADYINEITAQQVADDTVGKISLSVSREVSADNLLDGQKYSIDPGTEDGYVTISDGVVSIKAAASADGTSAVLIDVPDDRLRKTVGNSLNVSVDYKVEEAVTTEPPKISRITAWVYYASGNIAYPFVTLSESGSTTPVSDWKTANISLDVKSEIPTRILLYAYVNVGTGKISIKNPVISLKYDKKNEISLSKDGVPVSTASLDLSGYASQVEYSELKVSVDEISSTVSGLQGDYTEVKQQVDGLSVSVVKNGEVRTKFAADSSSVTISSGRITFSGNTLVVSSTNFTLSENGSVRIIGSFTAKDSLNQVDIINGNINMFRRDGSGQLKNSVSLFSSGTNASCGELLLYCPGVDGNQKIGVYAKNDYTGGSFYIYNSGGQEKFRVSINGNGEAEVYVNGSKKF